MPYSEDDDSQSGFASDPMHGMSKAELRKTNKPIMEKKRRARINNCLNELKDLLTGSLDKDPARHSKLEKADILELTVKHLQTLQRQQLAAAIAADPAVLHRFRSGFGDCAVEVRRYLSRLASVPTGLRHRLGNHLSSCLSGIQRLNPPADFPLVPDPLRLDDERPSAFHYVKSTRPTSPPLSPMSCDSACDSSTELETPPRPVQNFPFPTPPSRSASDQDSSPETQKATVSSTTISPEMLKQEALRNRKYMEPLSIVIDVENYKIGIDASPKRAVDYSIRQKLKRHVPEVIGPLPKVIRLEPQKTVIIPGIVERKKVYDITAIPENLSAFKRISERPPIPEKKLTITIPKSITTPVERPVTIPESITTPVERPVTIPESITTPVERPMVIPESIKTQVERPMAMPESITTPVERPVAIPKSVTTPAGRLVENRPLAVQRSVISHTAESLAQSSARKVTEVKEKVEADTSSRSPGQGTSASTSTEMWRPW